MGSCWKISEPQYRQLSLRFGGSIVCAIVSLVLLGVRYVYRPIGVMLLLPRQWLAPERVVPVGIKGVLAVGSTGMSVVSYDGLSFERLGHASVRIETEDGTVIYIDPWSEIYDGSPGDGDIVLVTHDDFDHYDPAAIEAVAAPDATIAIYEAVDTSDLDREVQPLPLEGSATVAGIDVQTVPAYNDPDGAHVDEDGDPFHAEGEVIGLLLTLSGTTVFFPGDTDFLPHHESITADIFMPPIGGHFTMDRHEAAEFTASVDPDLVLPLHYDTFEPIETDAEAFVEDVEAEGIEAELF